MIKFQHDGKLYRLKFFHDRELFVNSAGDSFLARGGMTTAAIDVEEDGKWQDSGIFGTGYCHPEDTFCKAEGRKFALRNLFEDSITTREFRKAIGAAYWGV